MNENSDDENSDDLDSLDNLESFYAYQLGEVTDECKQKLIQEINSVNRKVKDLSSRVKKYEEQNITILGIFAAVLLAFVGAFTFSTSVLQNMDKGDIHRLVFVILCIAIFIASILRWLFDFLLRICGKETKCFKWWWVGIVICFLIVGYADWTNYYYNTSPCKEKGSLIGYLIHKEDCKSQNTQITTKINRFYLQLWPQEEK